MSTISSSPISWISKRVDVTRAKVTPVHADGPHAYVDRCSHARFDTRAKRVIAPPTLPGASALISQNV